MNRYEYNKFTIDKTAPSKIIKELNKLGQDGWHVYKQSEHPRGVIVWAARKIKTDK